MYMDTLHAMYPFVQERVSYPHLADTSTEKGKLRLHEMSVDHWCVARCVHQHDGI